MSSPSSNFLADSPAARGLGRAAGFGYVAIFVTGVLWYAVMQADRAGGDGQVLTHIRSGRLLFELSILSGAGTFVAYLVTASLLYRRYRDEAAVAVTLLFAFVVGSVPFSLVAVAREMQLLSLLNAVATPPDLAAQVAALMRDWDAIGRLSSLFWGLWLLPLAWIAWRSGGLGRPAGAFVALGGLGYVSAFVTPVLWPVHALGPVDIAAGGATVLSELVITLWLLLASDRPRTRAAPLAADRPEVQ